MRYLLTTLFLIGGIYLLDKTLVLFRSKSHMYQIYLLATFMIFVSSAVVYNGNWK